MPSTIVIEALWLPRVQAAAVANLSPQQFDEAIRPRLPAEAKRGSNKSLRYYAPAVVATLIDYRLEQAKPQPEDADPLLSGVSSNSPSLERYRAAMASLRERDLAERDGAMIKTDAVMTMLRPLASIFRGGVDRARRQFGNEVGDFMNEVADEFERSAEDVFRQLDEYRSSNKPDRNPVLEAGDRPLPIAPVAIAG